MQNETYDYILKPEDIKKYLSDFKHKSPFNLRNSIKIMMKEYNILEDYFYTHLVNELSAAFKITKAKDYIYHNGKYYKIAIIKFRMQDEKANSGKSNWWRIVALIDGLNRIFYLLDLYKHSQGKDNLTAIEIKKLKELCDEYADSLKEIGY